MLLDHRHNGVPRNSGDDGELEHAAVGARQSGRNGPRPGDTQQEDPTRQLLVQAEERRFRGRGQCRGEGGPRKERQGAPCAPFHVRVIRSSGPAES